MAASLSGEFNLQAFTDAGVLAASYRLYTYTAGTTTHRDAYTDSAGSVPHTYTSDGSGGQFIGLNARGELPAPLFLSSGAYDLCLKTPAGVTVWTRRAEGASGVATALDTALRADLATSNNAAKGAGQAGHSVDTEYTGSTIGAAIPWRSVKQHGALRANTSADNKTALQAAITAVQSAGRYAVVTVPPDVSYGVKTTDSSTWPSFSGVTVPTVVLDHSKGESYAGFPTAYDGAQWRLWMHTPQTTSLGQHDGNTLWLRGAWAPAMCVSNDMDLAAVGNPARLSTDNRRAFYATCVDGKVIWQWGQGSINGADKTDAELSSMVIDCFGSTIGGIDFNFLVVSSVTGHASIGAQTNAPAGAYHFKEVTAASVQQVVESLGGTTIIALRNSNGSGDDVSLRNATGACELHVNGGSGFSIAKTTRVMTISKPLGLPVHTVATVPAAASNTNLAIVVTDATGGRCIALSNGTNWISMITGSAI